jgi:hypothetical protein
MVSWEYGIGAEARTYAEARHQEWPQDEPGGGREVFVEFQAQDIQGRSEATNKSGRHKGPQAGIEEGKIFLPFWPSKRVIDIIRRLWDEDNVRATKVGVMYDVDRVRCVDQLHSSPIVTHYLSLCSHSSMLCLHVELSRDHGAPQLIRAYFRRKRTLVGQRLGSLVPAAT